MRMFLVVMCDIFLMLYLTAIIDSRPKTVLTVEDFYQLSILHENLESDKDKAEAKLQEKLRRVQAEKERLLAQKKKQEELVMAQLAEEQARLKELEQSLALSDSQRERVEKDLKVNEEILKNREQLLEKLNSQIAQKEEEQRRMQVAFLKELEEHSKRAEESQKEADESKMEANNAQRLAEQMRDQADLAMKTAETANTVREKALQLKELALAEKEVARRNEEEALAALRQAQAEKEKTLKELQAEKKEKFVFVKVAQELADTIEDIKQDGAAAYENNMRPHLQTVNIIFKRKSGSQILDYRRELKLLPVTIDGETTVVFPTRQVGYTRNAARGPDKIIVYYQGKLIKSGWINKDDELIALILPGFDGQAQTPYPPDTVIDELMPALVAVRNNGNIAMSDKILGVAEDYFIVNRDYLQPQEDHFLKFTSTGWRGTRSFAERIVLGDQLVDLNGRLIGVANDADRVVRIETINGWSEIKF